MEEFARHGAMGVAAMKSNMDRKTARKYVAAGKLPSEMVVPRNWRTREDPFVEHDAEIEALLRETPTLEVRTVFEILCNRYPGRYEAGQVRTLQRRVRAWRAALGPEKEVVLAQQHRAGEAMQTDFTNASELLVTLAGELFAHLLCVVVLPFSNWGCATICLSESMAGLRKGVQRALFQLGRAPQFHQTDNSTAATHRIPHGDGEVVPERKRPFNASYLAMMRHFGMTPRTTEVGAKEQNGDVEAANGALKRRLEQALLVRGSRDFASAVEWQTFIDDIVRKANAGRIRRFVEDLDAMHVIAVARLPEYVEHTVRVSEWSTIRVKHCAYSVPSRLIREIVKVHLYEDRLEVYFGDALQLACERLLGHNQRRIDYHHMIWSLVRKPGGFSRYIYREEMFPTLAFRRAYDSIQQHQPSVRGDVEYLRILHLAASTMEADVEAAITLLLADRQTITSEKIKALVTTERRTPIPDMAPLGPDLTRYDALLKTVAQ
jgi:hypothetical protein